MRLLSVCIAGLIVVSAASAGAQQPATNARGTIRDVSWLAGDWRMDARGVSVEERWGRPAGGAMLATNRTIKGDTMVAFEFLRIVERQGTLVYIAQPNGQPPTEFVLTRMSLRSATFENPQHDFPKVITYTLRGDGMLEARVGDGERQTDSFVFSPMR